MTLICTNSVCIYSNSAKWRADTMYKVPFVVQLYHSNSRNFMIGNYLYFTAFIASWIPVNTVNSGLIVHVVPILDKCLAAAARIYLVSPKLFFPQDCKFHFFILGTVVCFTAVLWHRLLVPSCSSNCTLSKEIGQIEHSQCFQRFGTFFLSDWYVKLQRLIF